MSLTSITTTSLASPSPPTTCWLLGTSYYPFPRNAFEQTNLVTSGFNSMMGALSTTQTSQAPVWSRPEQEQVAAFLAHFQAKLWFSYRSGFAPIGFTNFTADSGWGCMLRCGQMMLSEALLRLSIGPDYARKLSETEINTPESLERFEKLRQVLGWFHDVPTPQAPYSIHQLSITGAYFHIDVGKWHSPSSCAQVIASLVQQHRPFGMNSLVCLDGTVYRSDVLKFARERATDDNDISVWHPMLLLIPVRLGVDFNVSYLPALSEFFTSPLFLGFAGAKQGNAMVAKIGSNLGFTRYKYGQTSFQAMYFIGADGTGGNGNFYFMDPHRTQNMIPVKNLKSCTPAQLSSFHNQQAPFRVRQNQLDPSLLLGFLCATEQDFDNFTSWIKTLSKRMSMPFIVVDNRPAYMDQLVDAPDTDDWQNDGEPLQKSKSRSVLAAENLLSTLTNATTAIATSTTEADEQQPQRSSSKTWTSRSPPPTITVLLRELVACQTSQGEVRGILVLSTRRIYFEPLRLEPLTRIYGLNKFRWSFARSDLLSCKLVKTVEDNDDSTFVMIRQEDVADSPSDPAPIQHLAESQSIRTPLINENQIKTLLCQELQSAMQRLQMLLPSSPSYELKTSRSTSIASEFETHKPTPLLILSEITSDIRRLVDRIEMILRHGFVGRPAGLWSPPLRFWDAVLKPMLPKEDVDLLLGQDIFDSDSAYCQAWIRLALNRGSGHAPEDGRARYSLPDFMESLSAACISGVAMGSGPPIAKLYSEDALIRDLEYLPMAITVLTSTSLIDFRLPIVDIDPSEDDNQMLPEDSSELDQVLRSMVHESPPKDSSNLSTELGIFLRLDVRNRGAYQLVVGSKQTAKLIIDHLQHPQLDI